MWGAVILFVVVIALVTLWDAKRIQQNESKKDLWVYLGLMASVTTFGVMSILSVQIPSPLVPLEQFFTPIGKLIIGD